MAWLSSLKRWARSIKRDVVALYLAARDARVPWYAKAVAAAVAAYALSPIDLIPDFIPFLGQVDDVFILMASLQRLVGNAGHDVILDHWHGDPGELDELNLKEVVSASTLFLPGGVRTKLAGMVRPGMSRSKR